MVRDNRIKELYFTKTVSATTTGSFTSDPTLTKEVINGEILEVDWSYNLTGSIALSFGNTGEEFFRRNAPSGAGWQVTRPGVFNQNATTGSIAGAFMQPYVTNDVIWLTLTGAPSGTAPLQMHVRYR